MKRTTRKQRDSRQGYVLVMCLLVIAVTSTAVLTLFNMLRLQTAESAARRQLTVASSVTDAGIEHAIAILLDNPTFRGSIGPLAVPGTTNQNYTIQITDVSGDMQIDVLTTVGTSQQAISQLITNADLHTRRVKLRLTR